MKNMLEILQDELQEGMEIKNVRELSNKWKLSITYDDMQATTELYKMVAPGCELEVCRTAINNAMSTMYINVGNLIEAKSWIDGEKWNLKDEEDEEIEYQRVNNDTWICNQLEELLFRYEQDIDSMINESNNVSGDEFIEGQIEELNDVLNDLKRLLYEK